MSLMFKCDRCGKIYEPHYHNGDPAPEFKLEKNHPESFLGYHEKQLCPTCIASLSLWFERPDLHFGEMPVVYCGKCGETVDKCHTKKKRWWQK